MIFFKDKENIKNKTAAAMSLNFDGGNSSEVVTATAFWTLTVRKKFQRGETPRKSFRYKNLLTSSI